MTLSAAGPRPSADDEERVSHRCRAPVGDRGVAMEDLDVVEGHTEPVGDDLAPRRLVAPAVRARAGDDLDLAGREHPDRRRLQAPAP